MPMPIVPPERVRAEAKKQKKKEERLARAAARRAGTDAFRKALSKGRTPFLDRLAEALTKNAGFKADLAAWAPVATAVLGLPVAEQKAAVAFVVAVEAVVPGLGVVPFGAHDRILGEGFVQLSRVQDLFVRPLSTFAPRTRSRHGQWDALIAHLCFQFRAPLFLEHCFLEHGLCLDARRLAPHIGAGGSWRDTALPLTLTRKAAHLLSTSKERFPSLTHALRWAQAAAVGVTPAQWSALSSTAPPLTSSIDVAALYDFVARNEFAADDLKAVAEEFVRVDTAAERSAKNFAFKGRTSETVVRWARAQKRERELRDKGRFDVGPLPRCDVDGGRYVLHREAASTLCAARIFAIEQIVDGEALVSEGIAMKHCVGTYAATAKKGEVAIFTMKVGHDGAVPRRAVTIEVDPKTKTVKQVRGKANRRADDDEKGVLRAWAEQRGLHLERYA